MDERDSITEKLSASEFKKLCFDVESFSNREWTIDKILTDTYPNSFYYCTFKNSQLIFACHIHFAIFALVDQQLNPSQDYLSKGFVNDPGFKQTVSAALHLKNIYYNFPDADFFDLKFYDKHDFEIKSSRFDPASINLVLKQLRPALSDFRLYPGNVGGFLFHYLED